MKKLVIIKRCSCGKTYDHLPEGAKPWIDEGILGRETRLLGYDYQCACKSNLFFKFENVLDEEKEIA